MDFTQYNDVVQQWIQQIMQNRETNAELTLKYANDIIEYGQKNDDCKLMGIGYYYSGEIYYGLNDGEHFFETMNKALSYLNQAEEWDLMTRCYNYMGIAALNRGNIPIALDYYLNGLNYCETYHFSNQSIVFNVNLGVLYYECGRYADAQETLEKAYDLMMKNPIREQYDTYMFCIYSNLARALAQQGKLDRVKEIIERVHKDHWDGGQILDKVSFSCVEVLYYHRMGMEKERDEKSRLIMEMMPENLSVLDSFFDFYDCCRVLLEAGKDEAFWHIVDILEPLVRNFNITNLQMKIISLKMKYYRKNEKNAEFLQAAGLYYELSELMEIETNQMISNVIALRRNLESARQARQKAEQEKAVLQKKSELDALTGMANRFRMNDYSDHVFAEAMADSIPLAVEILDIDYFKEYNDNYGHQQGDKCLEQIAAVIKQIAEENQIFCARYGGDEFVIIYKDVTREQIVAFAAELKRRVMSLQIEHRYSKALPVVTVSQGICWDIPRKGNKMWDFLHSADNMLYRVKKFSRNTYCVGDVKETDDMILGTLQ